MTMNSRFLQPARLRAGTAGAAAMLFAACGSSVTDAPLDDIISPDQLSTPAAVTTVVNGVRGDFSVAFSGTDGGAEGWILMGGLLADEFEAGDTFPTRIEVDQRRMQTQNASLTGVERNLHRARAAAERAEELIREVAPTRTVDLADMLNYAGLVDVAFAEGYCSGIPASKLVDGILQYGPPRTTAEMLATVIARADSATEAVASNTTAAAARARNGAAVLKGRALLNLGQYAEAAAAVSAVPTSFVDVITHSAAVARTVNGVFAFNDVNIRRWQVGNGRTAATTTSVIAYFDAQDPRAPVVARTGVRSFNGFFNPLLQQQKYTSRASSVPILEGVEARLIEAEAAMVAGDGVTYIARLNGLRATRSGLAPLVDPGTLAARTDLLFRERAFWLFATGHRLGDMRRLIRQYGRNAESVFPTGPHYRPPGSFSTDVNIPATIAEFNNPNYTGCLNRDA